MKKERLATSFVFFLIFVLMLSISACDFAGGKSKYDKQLPSYSWDIGDFNKEVSHSLEAEIFIDASTSMKGYVPPSQSTDYFEVIRVMESAIKTGWDSPQVSFYKFGSKVKKLGGRDYLQSAFPQFYTEPSLSHETKIEKIITDKLRERDNLLTVVITDLYQEDADASLLVNLIKDKCLEKGLVVGIAGIKSFFSGRIYDVGLNSENFTFQSQMGNEETYRPFYLITIGKHADVQQFFGKLIQNSSSIKENNIVVFSRHLAEPLLTFSGAQRVSETKNVNEIKDVTRDDLRVKQFRVLDEGVPIVVSYTVPYVRSNYAPSFDATAFLPEISIFEFKETAAGLPLDLSGKVSAAAVLNKGGLSLKMEFAAKALDDDARYQIRVVVRPGEGAYKLPDFVEEWDLPLLRKVSLENEKQLTAIGPKTQNLAFFMNNLMQANYRVNKPRLFESCIYLKY